MSQLDGVRLEQSARDSVWQVMAWSMNQRVNTCTALRTAGSLCFLKHHHNTNAEL